ncbi:peamaclein-like [Chenopodium quinoa]|uniref:peamaclein-like n=1 Tax=Chenopodium quinoa TaxID=63459 RepID=UPI000B77AF9E|nr:peamaclein-like [Chenopodium quinoa]
MGVSLSYPTKWAYVSTLVIVLVDGSCNTMTIRAETDAISNHSSKLDKSGTSMCASKCNARCSKAGVKDRCLKYCNICCMKCKCVPSGTYGNKHECPCYRDMKNNKNKPKCP